MMCINSRHARAKVCTYGYLHTSGKSKKTPQPTPPAEPPSSTASPNEAAALQLSSQSAASQIIQTRTRKCVASVLVCARATATYDINSRIDFIHLVGTFLGLLEIFLVFTQFTVGIYNSTHARLNVCTCMLEYARQCQKDSTANAGGRTSIVNCVAK